jgi:hypothetical protein
MADLSEHPYLKCHRLVAEHLGKPVDWEKVAAEGFAKVDSQTEALNDVRRTINDWYQWLLEAFYEIEGVERNREFVALLEEMRQFLTVSLKR